MPGCLVLTNAGHGCSLSHDRSSMGGHANDDTTTTSGSWLTSPCANAVSNAACFPPWRVAQGRQVDYHRDGSV
jgi:hypothetical protein